MTSEAKAIILAGGDSQRMGSDKANLLLGEQTLLKCVIATMQQVFPYVIVSVRQPRPEIDLPQVCDDQPKEGIPMGSGPLAGMVTSMDHVTTPWAFVVACDMPFILPGMIELLGKYRDQYQVVVPVVNGHPQTLAAFYASSCLATIRSHLTSGGKNSLRAVFDKLKVRYVNGMELLEVDASLRSFFDLDTPQDFANATGRFKDVN